MIQLIKQSRSKETEGSRTVIAWVEGTIITIYFKRSFSHYCKKVKEVFDKTGQDCIIYALEGPNFLWRERIQLSDDNFIDYLDKQNGFEFKGFKVYVVWADESPKESPFTAFQSSTAVDMIERKSDYSNDSCRIGQRDFFDSLRRRDNSSCVFCGSTSQLEGAHIIPHEQKSLLNDSAECVKYEISSINQTANGFLLCWTCHKRFDANLVYIHPDSSKLVITNALLVNETEKWQGLVDHFVPAALYGWPSKELLKYRERIANETTLVCNIKQSTFEGLQSVACSRKARNQL